MFKFISSVLFITALTSAKNSFTMEEQNDSNPFLKQDEPILEAKNMEARVSRLEKTVGRLITIASETQKQIADINELIDLDSEDEDTDNPLIRNSVRDVHLSNQTNDTKKSILQSSDFYFGTGIIAFIAYFGYRYLTYKEDKQSSPNF